MGKKLMGLWALVCALPLALLSVPAFAVLDISGVTDALAEGVVAVKAVGIAVLAVVVLIAVFRFIRRAI